MKYYARRFTFYAITVWAAISLNFFLPRLMPGNAADIFRAKLLRGGGEISPAMEKSIALLFGKSNDSLWDQYLLYWSNLLQGDLGVSVTKYPAPVVDLIASALPWTLLLVGTATVISFFLGVSLGAWAGWKRGTWVDGFIPASTLMQAIPYFWMALILVAVFSVQYQIFPVAGGYDIYEFRSGPEMSLPFFQSALYHAVLPALTVVISSLGGWLLGMRNMMVATLSEDYIVTAEAKGLRPSRILTTYATRNAILPSIAGFGITLGFVVAGSIVMERVFSYPGIGKLMIDAVEGKDFSLMQGVFLVITLTVLAANFLMDMLYGFIDPRARQNV